MLKSVRAATHLNKWRGDIFAILLNFLKSVIRVTRLKVDE